ncbi:uncharacterized protein LOC123297925 [Chrysoperla carnea]|uniref:uncharacterized protein LOC123297925 n=1 Tax=Chrysoperla carnea TaxID=189513 RepID=UPI001D088AE3|nr:uncharacterized protein LOC123297925 [Chrysoperla carnea]
MVRLIAVLLITLAGTNGYKRPSSKRLNEDVTSEKWINKCAYHTESTLEINHDLMAAKSACASVGQCLNTESLRVDVRAEEFVKGSLGCMEDFCSKLKKEMTKKNKQYDSEVCWMAKGLSIMSETSY